MERWKGRPAGRPFRLWKLEADPMEADLTEKGAEAGAPRPALRCRNEAQTTFRLISLRPSTLATMVWPRVTAPTPSGVPEKMTSPGQTSK